MSEGLNRWVGVGQLAADPELRFTQSNQGVLSFRIAVNEGYWDEKTKERKEKVEWVPICVWGKRGEALNKILAKGRQVLIEGRLQTRSWDDKTGAKRYTTEIVASNVGSPLPTNVPTETLFTPIKPDTNAFTSQ